MFGDLCASSIVTLRLLLRSFLAMIVRSSSVLLMYMSIIPLSFIFARYISALVRRRYAAFCLNFLLVSDGAAVGTVVFSFDGGPETADNSSNIE